jgi:hypothetical protein
MEPITFADNSTGVLFTRGRQSSATSAYKKGESSLGSITSYLPDVSERLQRAELAERDAHILSLLQDMKVLKDDLKGVKKNLKGS